MNRRYNRYTADDLPFDTYTDAPIEIIKDEDAKKETKREKRHKERIKEKLKNSPKDVQKEELYEEAEANEGKESNNNQFLHKIEEINSENLKYHQAKSRRNRVVIVALIVLLAIAITTVSVYAYIIRMQNNCRLYAHGDGKIEFYIDGEELDMFRSPNSIQGNRVFAFDLDVKIKSDGQYSMRFIINVYENDTLIENTFAYDYNNELFSSGADGYYYSITSLSKSSGNNGLIDLCDGVAIDGNESTLNIDNFKMEIHVYLEKI